MPDNSLKIEYVSVAQLRDNAHSARRHSKKKIAQLAYSIRRLGFNVPLIIDKADKLLAGHARLAAAKLEGMDEVPVVRIAHLSEVEQRAFTLADNKFALNACRDFELLADELKELVDVGLPTRTVLSELPPENSRSILTFDRRMAHLCSAPAPLEWRASATAT